MHEKIHLNWDGVINKSAIVIAKQAIHWHKRVKLTSPKVISSGLVALLISLIFFITTGVNLLRWFENIYLLTAMITSILVCLHFLKIKNAAEKKSHSFRELLMRKIDADLCNCRSSCNHKEEFVEYMQEEQGINVYY